MTVLAFLAGCRDGGTASAGTAPTSEGPTSPDPAPDPPTDDALARTALAAELRVLDRLSATVVPAEAREPLEAAAAVHRAHVELLGVAAGIPQGSATPGPSLGFPSTLPTPTTTSPTATPPTPGPEVAAHVARLVRDERALVEQHSAASVTARSGRFARVLAGMAAAAAQQAVVLERLAVRLRTGPEGQTGG